MAVPSFNLLHLRLQGWARSDTQRMCTLFSRAKIEGRVRSRTVSQGDNSRVNKATKTPSFMWHAPQIHFSPTKRTPPPHPRATPLEGTLYGAVRPSTQVVVRTHTALIYTSSYRHDAMMVMGASKEPPGRMQNVNQVINHPCVSTNITGFFHLHHLQANARSGTLDFSMAFVLSIAFKPLTSNGNA